MTARCYLREEACQRRRSRTSFSRMSSRDILVSDLGRSYQVTTDRQRTAVDTHVISRPAWPRRVAAASSDDLQVAKVTTADARGWSDFRHLPTAQHRVPHVKRTLVDSGGVQ